jgi:EAL domain-containing protein (putative c-di-GMP-specific phosphodiesterase class I)
LNDENFVNEIQKLVDKYKIPYQLLELELTESIFLNNTEAALTMMKDLRKLGFGVSIDDFGAGYSSLNLLKDMETDVIKLDKEFFGQGEMQKEEQIIVSSIISMAKQLNMKVLSEGVETQMQSDFLKSVSCDMAQGFLYSKPIPILDFEKMMSNQNDCFD